MSQRVFSADVISPDSIVREIVYDQSTIIERIGELGYMIGEAYKNRDLLVVGILKGAFIFTCDLVRSIPFSVDLDFISVSRYHPKRDQGRIRLLKDLQEDINGKHLLLVEDIVDTGFTAHYLLQLLSKRKPASISFCTFLDRKDLRLVEIPIKFVGFQARGEFLIGYGLDYQDHYRNLPYVANMNLDASSLYPTQSPAVNPRGILSNRGG